MSKVPAAQIYHAEKAMLRFYNYIKKMSREVRNPQTGELWIAYPEKEFLRKVDYILHWAKILHEIHGVGPHEDFSISNLNPTPIRYRGKIRTK